MASGSRCCCLSADTLIYRGGVYHMSRRTSGQLTAAMRTAAIMTAAGRDPAEIADTLHVTEDTVRGWLRRDDVISIVSAAVAQSAQLAAGAAQAVLAAQLRDASPWVAQGAAREILRQAAAAQGVAAAQVQVIIPGMPTPGSPAAMADDSDA